jgi:hypothetical protein
LFFFFLALLCQATESSELSIKVGDILEILEQDSGGWWKVPFFFYLFCSCACLTIQIKGRLGDVVGFFPSNFCELVASEASPAIVVKVEASSEVLDTKQGWLRWYSHNQWKRVYGVIRGESLVLLESQGSSVELGKASLSEPVRRGAPGEVVPPPKEENCQFSLDSLLLSAPSFAFSQDWVTLCKTYYAAHLGQGGGTLGRASGAATTASSLGSNSSSPRSTSAATSPSPSRPARKPSLILSPSVRKGTVKGSPDKGTSPSPGRKSETSSSAPDKHTSGLDNLGKKAAELLFRRKERKERQNQRDQDSPVSWPSVGKVQVVPADLPPPVVPPALPRKPTVVRTKEDLAKQQQQQKQECSETVAVEALEADDDVEFLPQPALSDAKTDLTTEIHENGSIEQLKAELLQKTEALELERKKKTVDRAGEGIEISKLKTQLREKNEELERGKRAAQSMIDEEVAKLKFELAKQSLSLAGQDERSKVHMEQLQQEMNRQVVVLKQELEERASSSSSRVAELEEQLAVAQQMLNDVKATEEQTHNEMNTVRVEYENMEAALTALQQEKEHLRLELKLKEEANRRALTKMEVLTEEKQLNRKTIKELNEALEQQLQHVFTENANVEELEGQVTQLQQEKERLQTSALARTKQIESLTAICDDQKQQLETVWKQKKLLFRFFKKFLVFFVYTAASTIRSG